MDSKKEPGSEREIVVSRMISAPRERVFEAWTEERHPSTFVSSHMRDIGIRIAIGAGALQVARDATASILRLGLAGGAAGLFGALAVSRILRATLYETSPVDIGVYAAAGAVLTTAFIAASYVPVRRALRVNPVDVLRND